MRARASPVVVAEDRFRRPPLVGAYSVILVNNRYDVESQQLLDGVCEVGEGVRLEGVLCEEDLGGYEAETFKERVVD